MSNSALRGKSKYFFQQFFANFDKIFILDGRLETRLKLYQILGFS